MYSPNNNDSMQQQHALRMNFPPGTNAGNGGVAPNVDSNYYNEFHGGQQPQPQQHNGFNRMRPNFIPANSMMQQQQHFNHNQAQPPQQPQPASHRIPPDMGFNQQYVDQPFTTTHANEFNDFNMTSMTSSSEAVVNFDNDWRSRTSSEVRQGLLNKLKEALTSQNYPNAQGMAEAYEQKAFIGAASIKDYQFKLVEWLASIYDTDAKPDINVATSDTRMQQQQPPPVSADSSTNGLNDVTTTSCSPKVLDQSSDNHPEKANDDLMTPKSESCLSPSALLGSPASSASGSPLMSSSNVITTMASVSTGAGATTTCTTVASSSLAVSSSNSSTFQCPPPIVSEATVDKSSLNAVVPQQQQTPKWPAHHRRLHHPEDLSCPTKMSLGIMNPMNLYWKIILNL